MSDAHGQLSSARDVQGSGWSADLNMNTSSIPSVRVCFVKEVRIGLISQSTLEVSRVQFEERGRRCYFAMTTIKFEDGALEVDATIIGQCLGRARAHSGLDARGEDHEPLRARHRQ
jgi:hypothetical protein